jgi:flagellar export protein FliJ
MSAHLQKSLGTLVDLRGRELEKRQAELAVRQSVCARVETNIERLGQLMQGISTAGAMSADLAMNAFAYKQSLLELADGQRRELALKRSDVSQAQAAVNAAVRQQEVLDQLLIQARATALLAQKRRAQKQQDDLATQVWIWKQA